MANEEILKSLAEMIVPKCLSVSRLWHQMMARYECLKNQISIDDEAAYHKYVDYEGDSITIRGDNLPTEGGHERLADPSIVVPSTEGAEDGQNEDIGKSDNQ